jgi:sugar phosphate isomerase/epimerase
MKLTIDFGIPFRVLGLYNGLKAVKEAGFDGIDFSFKDESGQALLYADNWEDHAWEVRRALDKAGLTCSQTHAPIGFSVKDKICPKAQAFSMLIRSLRFSQILGAKNVVVHAVTDVKPVDFIPYNLRFYKTLEPYAKKSGVRIAVENLYEFDKKYHRFEGILETGEKLSAFLQKLRSTQFVACVDTGHALLTGTAPEKFLAGMNKGLVQCLHLHDNNGVDDLHSLPYTGVIAWEKVLSALKQLGYEGDLNFELMYFLEKFTAEELPAALGLAGEIAKKFQAL